MWVTLAEWAAWITLRETREEKTRMSPLFPPSLTHHHTLSPSLTLLPEIVFFYISLLRPEYNSSPVPSEALRLYLGVHLTLHYSESASVMRPKLSDTEWTLPPAGQKNPRGDFTTPHTLVLFTAYQSGSHTPLIWAGQTDRPCLTLKEPPVKTQHETFSTLTFFSHNFNIILMNEQGQNVITSSTTELIRSCSVL